MPFTTWPSRTSRQAMIRFDSMSTSELQKISQQLQPDVPGLFRMKLDAGNVPVLDDCRELFTVLGDGDGIARHRSDVAVGEVHLGAARDAVDDRGIALDGEPVPPDVRDFDSRVALKPDRAKPITSARQDAQARNVGRFVAALEQPLHAEADPEERPSFADALHDRILPRTVERTRRAEMTNAGNDYPLR